MNTAQDQHRPGCPALGGYGHGTEDCICGTAQDQRSRAEADQWKYGNELLPYHPSASHVEPAYRDGWNACFKAAAQVQAMLERRGHGNDENSTQTRMDAGSHRGRGVPYGWQLAPLEPTEEQLAAVRQRPHPANPSGWDANHRRIYREMLAAVPQPPAAQEHAYICPVRTVADLVNNLLLMDQTLPIYGAQYIEHPAGRRRVITVPPTVSRERVKDSRWIGEGDELNAAVVWTRAEQPAAQEIKPLTEEQIQDLIGFGDPTEQECHLVRLGWDAAQSIEVPR